MESKPLRTERGNWGASAAPGWTGNGGVALAVRDCFCVKSPLFLKGLRFLEGDSASTSCPEVAASGERNNPALGRLEGLLQIRLESRAPMVGITLASAQKHACGSTNGSPICVLILRGNHYAKLFSCI